MSTVALHMASPKSLKRAYADAGLEGSLQDYNTSSASSVLISLPSLEGTKEYASSQASTASSATNALPLPGSSAPLTASGPPSSSVATMNPPSKKTKLTAAEKESKRLEKEAKALEKAKKEEEKEEEKARKEEEKRTKDAAKEDRRKAKEEQARLKQEEKQKKEEEENKKARSQLRLNSFFTQPNGTSGSPTHGSPLSSRRSSISEIHTMEVQRRSRSVSETPQKAQLRDYKRIFLNFQVKFNTILAPCNRFSRDEKDLQHAKEQIDEGLKVKQEANTGVKDQHSAFNLYDPLPLLSRKRYRRPRPVVAVKTIMAEIDGTTSNPIDLTDSQFKRATQKPMDILMTVPVKYLRFAEDVRPPYVGTYTRVQDGRSVSKLGRNPFSRGLPDMNYDYDSEAEWEEPLEGEDLDSEGEEEPDDDEEGDEMDGFLDDEEVTDFARGAKRRPILGDLKPVCTGVCWEGPQGQALECGIAALDWHLLKLDILMENPQLPIDPYCTTYWQPTTSSSSVQTSPQMQNTLMKPPRFPLHSVNRQNTLLSPSTVSRAPNDASLDKMKAPKARKLITPELMDDFKAAVQGNDLTKIGILEVLKRQFPKMPKEAIKDTLEVIAERVGPRPAEKKWMLKSGF